jgi:hypothetical protein
MKILGNKRNIFEKRYLAAKLTVLNHKPNAHSTQTPPIRTAVETRKPSITGKYAKNPKSHHANNSDEERTKKIFILLNNNLVLL